MRVGIDCRLIGTRHGGIGRYTFELVKHILSEDKEDAYYLFYNSEEKEVIQNLVKNAGDANSPASVGISMDRCVMVDIRHYSLMEQLKFGRVLDRYNLDLVHFPNFNVPLTYKKPYVVT